MTIDHGRRGTAQKSYIIALEEHSYDTEITRHASGLDAIAAPATVQRLDDLGELRLKKMDEAGIDLQVLSHPAVIDAYYKDYVEKHPGILRAGSGFTVETATQVFASC